MFDGVKKVFRGKEVLSDVSFGIKKGEIFGLVGESGCGKTTLLKTIMGGCRVDSGGIFFENKVALENMNYLRKNTGFATQDNMLFNELTVKENGFYFGRLYNMKKGYIKTRFNELINLFKLGGFEHNKISQLSGGMAKRANLLVALMHKPKLLILDEPTIGLDYLLRSVLWGYIHKINKEENTTILVTSHLLDEIEENCDRIGILKYGTIVSLASVSEYKKHYKESKSFSEIFQCIIKNE